MTNIPCPETLKMLNDLKALQDKVKSLQESSEQAHLALMKNPEVPSGFKEGLNLIKKDSKEAVDTGDLSTVKATVERLKKKVREYFDAGNS